MRRINFKELFQTSYQAEVSKVSKAREVITLDLNIIYAMQIL